MSDSSFGSLLKATKAICWQALKFGQYMYRWLVSHINNKTVSANLLVFFFLLNDFSTVTPTVYSHSMFLSLHAFRGCKIFNHLCYLKNLGIV